MLACVAAVFIPADTYLYTCTGTPSMEMQTLPSISVGLLQNGHGWEPWLDGVAQQGHGLRLVLSLDAQVTLVTKYAFVQMRLGCQQYLFLDSEDLKTFIKSCMDYCRMLYVELLLKSVQKLQLSQNVAVEWSCLLGACKLTCRNSCILGQT